MLPYLLHIGHLRLPAFAALAALGLIFALLLSQLTAVRAGMSPGQLWDAGVFAVAAAYFISRGLLFAAHWRSFLAEPVALLTAPSLTPPGVLLTAVALLLWLRWRRVDVLRALDAWTPCALLVWGFLSLGHLAEGSDPGMTSRWGLRLPGNATRTHPVALYGCAAALLLAWWAMHRVRVRHAAGETAGLGLALAGVAQFFLSFLRTPGIGVAGLDVLQWVALGMVCAGGSMALLTDARSG